jgi:hypothetical protein
MTFQRNIPPPSSGAKKKPSKADLKLVYFLTLKMEVICLSKTLGCFQTAWHYNPDDMLITITTMRSSNPTLLIGLQNRIFVHRILFLITVLDKGCRSEDDYLVFISCDTMIL